MSKGKMRGIKTIPVKERYEEGKMQDKQGLSSGNVRQLLSIPDHR
jgi:hypothetical protein